MVNSIRILGFCKNSGLNCLVTDNEISKKKCEIELLEVLDHWGWIPMATEGFQGPFLVLGRLTYSHFPNRIFI